MNAVSHCSRPRASSSAMNARQIRSHVPSSSQRFSRRQHVEGLGYSAGRSRQRAPVFSTHRMPSIDRAVARPKADRRARLRGIRGRSGSILAHCASVRSDAASGPASTKGGVTFMTAMRIARVGCTGLAFAACLTFGTAAQQPPAGAPQAPAAGAQPKQPMSFFVTSVGSAKAATSADLRARTRIVRRWRRRPARATDVARLSEHAGRRAP